MNQLQVWEGRWSTGEVLIADHKIGDKNIVIVENGFGKGRYYLSGDFASKFPVEQMKTKKGGLVRMRVIPLTELEKEVI